MARGSNVVNSNKKDDDVFLEDNAMGPTILFCFSVFGKYDRQDFLKRTNFVFLLNYCIFLLLGFTDIENPGNHFLYSEWKMGGLYNLGFINNYDNNVY